MTRAAYRPAGVERYGTPALIADERVAQRFTVPYDHTSAASSE